MFLQASAQRHGIKIRHGTPNPGTGNCAFEAAIYNVNDRPCFIEKFPMAINWYRHIWVTDMANRTLFTDYNIYSNKEWLEGWNQMLEPGAYERGIFGDLMLPGIACGIRKYILIFNTNPDSPHEPIYVVDPSNFDVMPDNEIPVVLAYNMSHYESMEPCSEADISATIDIVKAYKEGRYRYTRQDIPRLINTQILDINKTQASKPVTQRHTNIYSNTDIAPEDITRSSISNPKQNGTTKIHHEKEKEIISKMEDESSQIFESGQIVNQKEKQET